MCIDIQSRSVTVDGNDSITICPYTIHPTEHVLKRREDERANGYGMWKSLGEIPALEGRPGKTYRPIASGIILGKR